MSFDAATKASILANLATLAEQVQGIQPTDQLEQDLAAAQELAEERRQEITSLSITVENRDIRIANALSAVSDARVALDNVANILTTGG